MPFNNPNCPDIAVSSSNRHRSVLVLRPDNLGDVVLFSGALRHIRVLYPQAKITLCVKSYVRNLVVLCPYVDEVIEYEKFFAGIYSQIAVGAYITIWDTRTGRKIWTDQYTERNHEGGIPLTLTDIPMITIRSGMNMREDAKIAVVDDLSRNLTRNIPVPETFNYSYTPMSTDANNGFSKYKSLKRLTKTSDRLVYSTKFKSLKRLTKKDRVKKSNEL